MNDQPKTRQQIADQYGVCPRTLNRLMQKHGIKLPKGIVCPKYQQLIREKIFMGEV